MELPEDSALTKGGRVRGEAEDVRGPQATPTLWDEALAQSKYNVINLDLGHYTAGTNESLILFLKAKHDPACA